MYLFRLRHNDLKLLGTTFALLCALYASASHAQINLAFGVYTTDKPTTMVKAYRPMLSELEAELSEKMNESVTIKLQVASSYQKGIHALTSGSVDFAMLGPASYVEANNMQPDLKILALDSKGDFKTFNGVICVHEDSDIEEISDLRGKRFAFGNEKSTLGRYLSQALLLKEGVHAKNLESYDYLDRHDRVAHAVAQGTHDAGALREGTFNKLRLKGLKLRVLATFPTINRPWVAKADLDPALFDLLQTTMLTLEAPTAFKAMGRKRFVEGTDADFIDIRTAINNNAAFFVQREQPFDRHGELMSTCCNDFP